MTRAYISNPSGSATTGVVSVTFDLPTGLVPSATALQGWRVRKWDGTVVDVTWWEPFAADSGRLEAWLASGGSTGSEVSSTVLST